MKNTTVPGEQNPVAARLRPLTAKLKNTAWYLTVPAVNFAISAFTFPILTTYLSAEDYGVIGYYNSSILFINIFFGLSFHTYYMSVYHRHEDEERNDLTRKLITALLLWNIIFYPLSVLVMGLFIKYNHVPVPLMPFGVLALGIAASSFFRNFVQINYRLAGEAFRFFVFMTGQKILITVGILLFVIYWKLGALGHYWGTFLAEGIIFLFVLFFYFRSHKPILDTELIRKAIRISLPLLPASLLYIPCVSYDTIILAKSGTMAELGIYNVGKTISAYVYTIGYAFYQVVEPVIYRSVNERNVTLINKIVVQLLLAVLFLIVSVNLFLPQIVSLLTNNRFIESIPYARVLVISSGFTVLFSVGDAILSALQKTKTVLLIHASAAVLCLFSHSYSVKHWGHIGVAWSTVLLFVYIFLLSTGTGIYKLRKCIQYERKARFS